MKKLFAALVLCVALITDTSCGDSKVINGKEYKTYGLFDKTEYRDPNVQYHLVTGNIIWSVLLAGTVIVPVLLIGLDLYEPDTWVGPTK